MLLTHFHNGSLGELNSVDNDPHDHPAYFYKKPNGFWLSDENTDWGWSHWCEAEQFARGENRTDFMVDMTDVLHIKTPGELLAFTDEYISDHERPLDRYIRWHDVAKNYKGILISPYQAGLRFDLQWYYSWDCASACIWDISCLRRRHEHPGRERGQGWSGQGSAKPDTPMGLPTTPS